MKRRSKNFSRGSINTKENEKELYNYLSSEVGDNNKISRYILEGHLLYTFKLSPERVYQILMRMTDNKVLELVQESDGEYYVFRKILGEEYDDKTG